MIELSELAIVVASRGVGGSVPLGHPAGASACAPETRVATHAGDLPLKPLINAVVVGGWR